MTSLPACSGCGAALPRDAPEGLCPACLLRLALASGGSSATASIGADLQPPAPAHQAEARYFGDYEVFEEIARGGMGIVLRARQVSLDRPVALKMILAGQLATPEQVTRFYSEAAAAAKLEHPNIVPIYEVGQHRGQHFYSMKLVQGGTLKRRTLTPDRGAAGEQARRPDREFGVRQAALVISKVARAVHYAHQRGILHRDLKPTNILLDPLAEPYVTDFGLAKVAGDELHLTQSAAVLGTPAYMAPEQAAGQAKPLTTAADIYSLGAIFYELLTGRAPFVGASALETMRCVIEREPTPPQALNPDVDRDLETVCLKCLSKEPEARYQSAEALAEDLERWRAGEPILARPASAVEKCWRWAKRKPALAMLWGALACALLVGAAGVLWQWQRAEARASEARQAAMRERWAAEQARDAVWSAQLEQARAQRRTGEAGQRFKSLEAVARAAAIRPSLELRNEAIAALALTDLRFVPVWTNPYPFFSVKFSPKLTRFAIGSPNRPFGRIKLFRASDGQQEGELPAVGAFASWMEFSPDEQFLAASYANGSNVLWDLSTQTSVLNWGPSPVSGQMTRDSQRLLAADDSGGVRCLALRGGQELWSCKIGAGLWSLKIQPQEKYFGAHLQEGPDLQVRELETGKLVRTLTHPSGVGSWAWSRDGTLLAVGCNDGHVFVWDAQTGQQRAALEGHEANVVGIGFNHAGTLLATTSWDHTIRLWDAVSFRPLLVTPGSSFQVQFSANDRWIGHVIRGAEVGLLEVTSSDTTWRVYPDRASHAGRGSLEFHPCGRLAATAHGDGFALWDLVAKREIAFVPSGWCNRVLFTPDGKSLIISGSNGLSRWPIAITRRGDHDEVRIGLRQVIREGIEFADAALSPDGGWVTAANQHAGTVAVYDLANPTHRFALTNHLRVANVAFSPDGRWIASGSWNGYDVKVWDFNARRLERTLSMPASANAAFSPDSRWLATSSRSCQVWEVGSWREACRIERPDSERAVAPMAFSPDSRLLALVIQGHDVQLLEPASGRVLANLEPPRQPFLHSLRFSPDGTQLAALQGDRQIQVWDLRRLRATLSKMNLDWDVPPYSPEMETQPGDLLPLVVTLEPLGP